MSAVRITAHTRLFALLGDPIAHSLSPVFQNAAMRHLGCDALYVALRCDAASAPALLHGIARAGGGGNITVPHKTSAASWIERATGLVQRTGACNTFWLEAGLVCGDNTDVAGFRRAVATLLPDLAGATVLVIGAGGAAAAAVCALIDDGVARITLHNRSPDRAHSLAARADPAHSVVDVATAAHSLVHQAYDLVVNASALGLRDDDPLPVELESLPAPRAVLDLVYLERGTTPLILLAQRLGIPAADGIEMLVGQGAAAFDRWFDMPVPIDIMRAALSDTLTRPDMGMPRD
jgi:shikimate dehydrogenase